MLSEADKNTRKIIRKVAIETRKLISDNRKALGTSSASLAGLCGHASLALAHNLRKEGLPAEIAQGVGHWFVKCGSFLVDITASQFSQGKICIRDYERTSKLAKDDSRWMGFWNANRIDKDYKVMGLDYAAMQIKNTLKIDL